MPWIHPTSPSIACAIWGSATSRHRTSWCWTWTWCSVATCTTSWRDCQPGWRRANGVRSFCPSSFSTVRGFSTTARNWRIVCRCRFSPSLSCSNLPLIPQNKSDLIQCLNVHLCMMRKEYARTHVWFFFFSHAALCDAILVWSSQGVSRITDGVRVNWLSGTVWLHFLLNRRYVILKYTPSTPLFDERFVNYGLNKIQFIEHLRAADYRFYILNHAFMVDLSHAE